MYLKNNEGYWIQVARNGKIIKTKNRKDATNFRSLKKINELQKRCQNKLKGYFVVEEEINQKTRKNRAEIGENGKRKSFSPEERTQIYERSFGKCYICGRPLMKHEFTIDHKKPLAQNGSNQISNLYCACSMCNIMKANYDWDDFMAQVIKIYKYQKKKKFHLKIKALIKSLIKISKKRA